MPRRTFPKFDIDKGDWTLYVKRLQQFFILNKIPKELQVPTLITVMGIDNYKLLMKLCSPEKPTSKTFKQITLIMKKYLQSKPSKLAERCKFRNRRQLTNENISDYVADLKEISITCQFGECFEEHLTDQLIYGIKSDTIRERLILEGDLDFVKAYNLAVSLEAAEKPAEAVVTISESTARTCLKLLQNLGKVDRTLDDIFEEHLQNFNRQHQQATRLQKEFNNYIRCIRAVQTASKTLMEAITEVYESSWSGHDLLYVQAQNLEMLWQDFSHKLGDQVLIPLNTYTNQFPEVRKKIEKRGRKLVDYDSQRHSFQNLQSNTTKRRDDVKVTKGREQLEEAKRTYEVLNSELHDELPALYDSRVLFYVNNLQTLFSAEQLFHFESHKVFGELEAITDKLATDCQRGSYSKKANNLSINMNNISPASSPNATLNNTHNGKPASPTDTVQTPPSPALNGSPPPSDVAVLATTVEDARTDSRSESRTDSRNESRNDTRDDSRPASEQPAKQTDAPTPPAKREDKQLTAPVTNNNVEKEVGDKKVEELYDIPVGSPVPPEKSNNNSEEKRQVDVEPKEEKGKENDNENKNDEVYDIPIGATLAGLPAGTLYRVRATYRYTREDSDELSFDVGEVIRVVEYDDPDEQVEEGWLMGIKESTNEKGMFPANFTRPI